MTFDLFSNAISSRGSADGPSPLDKPDGVTIAQSGPAPAHANLSARQAQEAGSLMSGTFGPHYSTLSHIAALHAGWESRLRAKTASRGSTLFSLTWKGRYTPLGRRISALRASAPLTSVNAYGSWATPKSLDGPNGIATLESAEREAKRKGWQNDLSTNAFVVRDAVQMAGWPTTTSQDAASSGAAGYSTDSGRHAGTTLTDAARMSSWATPAAREAGGTPEQFLARKAKAKANGAELGESLTSLSMQATLASWATPAHRDYRHANAESYQDRTDSTKGEQLNNQVVHMGPVEGWATPMASTQRKSAKAMTPSMDNGRRSGGGNSSPPGLEQQAEFAAGIVAPEVFASGITKDWPDPPLGPTSNGSPAETASGGQLNADFSLWMMGYGPAWSVAAIRAFSLSPKRKKGA